MGKRLLLAGLALVVGCAQALDDGYYGASGDASVKDSASSTDTGSTSKDTGSTKVDTSTTIDTYVEDTYVEDTYVEDTYVEDTGTVVVDTGPVTGTCSYCATGICKSPLEDYSCLLNCLLDGHFDCNYDTTSTAPCTCVD